MNVKACKKIRFFPILFLLTKCSEDDILLLQTPKGEKQMSEKNITAERNDIDGLRDGREKKIVRTSILGIVANVFLAGFKAVVGIVSNSVAVVLDAVNNLSDALSSVITIIGTKLASRKPDKKHPLGHGRIEYITSMIIAAIVLYAGITSLVESIKKIIHPETPDYSVLSLIIIAVAVVVKILLGRYVKRQGEKVNSSCRVGYGRADGRDPFRVCSCERAYILFLKSQS